MGGTLSDVMFEYRILWIQAFIYFVIAFLVYRYQIIQARLHALERLEFLKHKKVARMTEEAEDNG